MKLLIVNADDFGLSDGINHGVAVAHEQGIVTSASLMVLRPAVREAAAYAREHPDMSVGLHLDLGEWVYREGRWDVVAMPPLTPEAEIRRQITTFAQLLGHGPTHLDSHQHVHREQPLRSIVADVSLELGIPLRDSNPEVQYRGDFYGQTARGESMHEAIRVEALLKVLANLPLGITELGCHPATTPDSDLSYGIERSLELQTLCDPRVRKALQDHGIRLCSFTDIRNRAAGPGVQALS